MLTAKPAQHTWVLNVVTDLIMQQKELVLHIELISLLIKIKNDMNTLKHKYKYIHTNLCVGEMLTSLIT